MREGERHAGYLSQRENVIISRCISPSTNYTSILCANEYSQAAG